MNHKSQLSHLSNGRNLLYLLNEDNIHHVAAEL
jgi:hypothetical protein